MDKRKLNPQLLKDKFINIAKYKQIVIYLLIGSTIFNIYLRYIYKFSTLNYKNTPKSFTLIDYGLIALLLLVSLFFILQKKTHLYRYYKYMTTCIELFLFLFFLFGIYPNFSYINYGWHFPLHDFFLPPVMPIYSPLSMISSGLQFLSLTIYLTFDSNFYKFLEKKGLFKKNNLPQK
ncbi:hypothetical protein [Latilactobacillus fragifolii]|uniref:hypothetical protein n=1 Tax=Latilactobacillus fragifolii TaxID=2814244 RepID=UPI001ABB8422|nr:hypothetical protein [Latilactobacillus fragifolii]